MITIDSDYVSYIGKTENKGMENIRTEDIFYIDSSSRQIIVPDSWTAVGTLQDHLAEKVWFAVDRFFDDRDFLVDSNQIMVNYINAASEGYVYNCGEIYVWDPASNEVLEATPGTAPTGDELQRYNKVLFAWRISQNVTKKTGKITFAVRIGKFTLDIDNSEVGVDPEGQDWIWNTTIASLNVLESISSETGLDDEGNEWGIGDIARWFKSIAVAERHLTAIFNLVSGLERVAVGPKGDFTYDYYTIYPDGHYDTTSVGPVEKPPFEVDNQIQMLTTAGTLQTTACPWHYKLWINTQENPTDVLVPTINDGAPTTEDVWSSSKTSAVINATSTADRAYTDSKILSTTAAGGTTAAWATNPTTSYIQAQFGTSSATAATSGMSASGIRDYVKAQFTTTSNVSSSAGWTSSATKDYADSRIVNTPANTSTSVGLSASAVKDFMSTTYLTTADAATNYLSTATIDDTATTAVDKVWSANKVAEYANSRTQKVTFIIDNTTAPITKTVNVAYDDLEDYLDNGVSIIAEYNNISLPPSGIPLEDQAFYISKMAAFGITLTNADFEGYSYSFLIENNHENYPAATLYLLKYNGFVLKGNMGDSHINDKDFYIYQLGGSSDNSGIGFYSATWSNGETVARIISYHPATSTDVYTNSYLIATSNSSLKSDSYQYSTGYISNMDYTKASFPRDSELSNVKLYIGSNTTLYRTDTSSYRSYGTPFWGELTPSLSENIIKLQSSNTIITNLKGFITSKISYNNYITFSFINEDITTLIKFNNDDSFDVIETVGVLVPTPTTSDVGKMLSVNSSNNLIWATNAKHYSTTEQVIGTWIDGSTIYEKTVTINTLLSGSDQKYNHDISNIDKIVGWDSIFVRSDGTTIQHFATAGNDYKVEVVSINRTQIGITAESEIYDTFSAAYITIRYTKTSS